MRHLTIMHIGSRCVCKNSIMQGTLTCNARHGNCSIKSSFIIIAAARQSVSCMAYCCIHGREMNVTQISADASHYDTSLTSLWLHACQ